MSIGDDNWLAGLLAGVRNFLLGGVILPTRNALNLIGGGFARDNVTLESTDLVLPGFNVLAYGAKGDGVTDDSGAIQKAINAAAILGGGRVIFPETNAVGNAAVYGVANTLNLGGAGNPVSGVVLACSRRSLGQPAASLKWIGSSGGTLLEVRMAHSCALEHLAFNGNGLANYCVQWHYVSGDSLQCEMHDVRNCYFAGALLYNELIGEPDGMSSAGDASMIAHWNCFYNHTGTNTVAHVKQRTINALNNVWHNCEFYGTTDGGYPEYAVWNAGGSMAFHDCVGVVIGTSDFYITNDAGQNPGSLFVSGHESQSKKLLVTSTDGTQANRGTTFIRCIHTDILAGGDPDSIDWDVYGPGLTLIGCEFQADGSSGGNVRILNPLAHVFAYGVAFNAIGKGFQGYVETVQGSWRYLDGGGNIVWQTTQPIKETTGWGKYQTTQVSAFVTGSGASFGTLTAGEYVDIALNGNPSIRTTFQVTDTTVNAVVNRINAAFYSEIICYPAPTAFTQLRFRASQSIQIVGGSTGTLAKLGLTAGTTTSAGEIPLATLEGQQTLIASLGGTLQIGSDELAGMLFVSYNTGIGTGAISCIFQLQGHIHAVFKESTDPGSQFSTTKDNASTINVYWDGTANAYMLQSNIGVNSVIALQFIGIGQH